MQGFLLRDCLFLFLIGGKGERKNICNATAGRAANCPRAAGHRQYSQHLKPLPHTGSGTSAQLLSMSPWACVAKCLYGQCTLLILGVHRAKWCPHYLYPNTHRKAELFLTDQTRPRQIKRMASVCFRVASVWWETKAAFKALSHFHPFPL